MTARKERVARKAKKKKTEPEKRSREEIRSYTMSRVKNANTKIEVAFRKALWHASIRYIKNHKKLPGKPDIAITKHKIAIFCDGEFWHGKDWNLVREKLRSRRDYWVAKIERNIERDTKIDRQLEALGWTVLRYWGKDIEKTLDLCVIEVKEAILQKRIDSAAFEYAYEFCEFEAAEKHSMAAEPIPDYED